MVATGNHTDSDPLRGAPPSTGTAVQIVVIGFSKQSHDMRLKNTVGRGLAPNLR